MEYIKLTLENLETEHICCAISNNKDIQVASKKAWLKERIKDGLVFLKSVERGKCFIEYIPAENAWCPIEANSYMHINCFWVSGSFKGHGYANDLLNACIADANRKANTELPLYLRRKRCRFCQIRNILLIKGLRLRIKQIQTLL